MHNLAPVLVGYLVSRDPANEYHPQAKALEPAPRAVKLLHQAREIPARKHRAAPLLQPLPLAIPHYEILLSSRSCALNVADWPA
ncbi:hypothetical protein D3C81_2090820 [compost metagenome]